VGAGDPERTEDAAFPGTPARGPAPLHRFPPAPRFDFPEGDSPPRRAVLALYLAAVAVGAGFLAYRIGKWILFALLLALPAGGAVSRRGPPPILPQLRYDAADLARSLGVPGAGPIPSLEERQNLRDWLLYSSTPR